MGQIVKKKKKGRPAKADLSARDQETPERDLRRSLRRRNVKYVFDLDDYFDEDELFADDEDQRRREKKLKLLLKLQSGDEPESTASRERHAPSTSASSADEDGKPLKKRKIDEEMNEDLDEDNDEVNEEDNYNYEDDEEVRKTKPENKDEDSPPGTLAEASWLPLPDKKTLELILDKLQRKDIYGVYAEPVDPEELPDYHDVIDHPMDFATVRNKLRNGSYATFEQFESDVFLICSNAMQYNAPDTIYHKQARTIQELAKRKFHKIRLKVDRTEKDIKPELKTRFGSIPKKQIKRSGSRTVQEPVGSDFSSGATLATTVDIQNVPHTLQPFVSDKTSGMDGLVERSSFLNENNLDKVEESLPGKGPLSRFGRRSFVQDENRRATYSISFSLPVASSESIFSTFDGETKQLVPVGLYSDHSYARSLARFAATLGSVAWKVASKRIEQALPQGFKFGHGWVGEYEPLPTPVLMLENCSGKEPPFFSKVQPAAAPKNIEKIPIIADSSKESPRNVPFLEQKLPFLGAAGIRPPSASVMTAQPIRPNISEMNASFCLSPRIKSGGPHNLNYHNQTLQSRAFLESDKKSLKQVELNSPPSSSNNTASSVGNKHLPKSSEMETSKPTEFSSKSFNFSRSGSFKQPDHSNEVSFGGLPNGKIVNNRINGGNTTANLSSDLVKPANYYPHEQGHPGQGLSDPVQMMRKLTENAHNQQKPSNQSPDDTNNAAAAAARAWMSVGAGGLRPVAENLNPNKNQMYSGPPYNSVQSQVPQFRGEFPHSGSPMHAFVPQGAIPMRVGNQVQFQNQRMVFPQLTTADLSRFQVQSNWRNVSPQMHSRQKQESLPPDLNIGFQSSGSPGRPSSGVLVDSQQPDLALQL